MVDIAAIEKMAREDKEFLVGQNEVLDNSYGGNMSILGKLFGSKKIIDAGIDAADAVFYTEEEKAKHSLHAVKWKIELLKAYEPFKIAQRLLSIIFCVPYVFWFSFTFTLSFDQDMTSQFELLEGNMGKIVWTIIAFYFIGGVAESIGRARK